MQAISRNCRLVLGPNFPEIFNPSGRCDVSQSAVGLVASLTAEPVGELKSKTARSAFPLWWNNHCWVMTNASVHQCVGSFGDI